MIKTLQMLSGTIVIAVVDDATTLLQQSIARQQSVGQRILAGVTAGKDTVCVEAAVGDVAPVTGSFAAKMSQEAVEVEAGSVSVETGSFCVPKQDVLLLQRTYGLNTARALDAALGSKNQKSNTTTTTTTTTTRVTPNADNFETFDFAGDRKEKVMVKQCPDVQNSSGLMQTMDATVTDKQKKKVSQNLDADQVRVCACRNFLKDGVEHIYGLLKQNEPEAKAAIEKEAANDGADADTVKKVEGEVESEIKTGEITATFGMVCNQAKALKDWTFVAKMINHPTEVVPNFEAANIEGWEHCDKSWVIEGACAEIVEETTE